MNDEEIKLRTLANLPVVIGQVSIHPLSLKEIIEHGYENYSQALGLLTISKAQLLASEWLDQIPAEVSSADLIFYSRNDELIELLKDSLKLVCRTDNVLYNNGLYIDNVLFSSDTFRMLIRVVSIQNCVATAEEQPFTPLNDRVKKLKEKMDRNKMKIMQLKRNGTSEEGLSLSDLISIVCSGANGITWRNVFDLNMCQFHDQFIRLKMLDDYKMNVQALLHGADSKQIPLIHWMSKVK